MPPPPCRPRVPVGHHRHAHCRPLARFARLAEPIAQPHPPPPLSPAAVYHPLTLPAAARMYPAPQRRAKQNTRNRGRRLGMPSGASGRSIGHTQPCKMLRLSVLRRHRTGWAPVLVQP